MHQLPGGGDASVKEAPGVREKVKRFFALLLVCLTAAGCGAPAPVLYPDATPYDPLALAAERMYDGAYEEALRILGDLEGEDADRLREACETGIRDETYRAAEEAYAQGRPEEAAELFDSLGEYRGADARAESIRLDETAKERAEFERITEECAQALPGTTDPAEAAAIRERLEEAALIDPNAAVMIDFMDILEIGDGAELYERILAAMEEGGFPYYDAWQWAEWIESALATHGYGPDEALSLLWAANRICPLYGSEPEEDEESARAPENEEFGSGIRTDAPDLYEYEGFGSGDGVILFTTRRHYAGPDMAFIDLARMRYLPPELTPDCRADAGWIIEIHYDYRNVKQFTTFYNQGVQEQVSMQIYAMPGMVKSGTAHTIRGPLAGSKDTAVKASEFISGGAPDERSVSIALTKCVDWILAKNKKNAEKAAGN